jgi:hypothetical protein
MRAYAPVAKRQQGADRLAYNEDDLRRILWQAVDPNFAETRPATIRLGADIVLTRPIKLYPGQYNVTINGGRRFKIRESKDFSGNGFFQLADGQTSDIEFVGITFHMPTAVNIFECQSATTVNDVSLIECNATGYTGSVRLFSAAITATDVKVILDDATAFSVGPSGTVFTGKLQVGTLLDFNYYETRAIISRNNVGIGFGTTGPLRSVDINGAIRTRPETVVLTGNDPVLESSDTAFGIGDRTHFIAEIDSTNSGTIQFKHGYDGQIIIVLFSVDPAVTVNVELNDVATGGTYAGVHVTKKNHKPVNHDVVTFIYHDGEWCEMARAEGK